MDESDPTLFLVSIVWLICLVPIIAKHLPEMWEELRHPKEPYGTLEQTVLGYAWVVWFFVVFLLSPISLIGEFLLGKTLFRPLTAFCGLTVMLGIPLIIWFIARQEAWLRRLQAMYPSSTSSEATPEVDRFLERLDAHAAEVGGILSAKSMGEARMLWRKRGGWIGLVRRIDYRAVFVAGAIYLAIGIMFLSFTPLERIQFSSAIVFSVGLVLIFIGLINRERWREMDWPYDANRKMIMLVAVLLAVAFMVFLLGYAQSQYVVRALVSSVASYCVYLGAYAQN